MRTPITCRPFRPSDLPAVSRLWADEAGWGGLTAETWAEWFERTPHGPCLVLVAESGREVVGQIVFTPTILQCAGAQFRSLRMSAPIVRRDWRDGRIASLSLLHPVVKLWSDGLIAGAAAGYRVVYALPDPAWAPVLARTGRFQMTDVEFWQHSLEASRAPTGWSARRCDEFGPAHEEVFRTACEQLEINCTVRRTSEWLRYRLGGHLTVDVFGPDGRLSGYVAVHPGTGLIQDVLAVDGDALTASIQTFLAWLAQAEPPMAIIKAMATRFLKSALAAAGFRPVDYRGTLAVDVLDPRLNPAEFDPDLWYSVPAD
jgi:predicted N-acetyltransferase YhbS